MFSLEEGEYQIFQTRKVAPIKPRGTIDDKNSL